MNPVTNRTSLEAISKPKIVQVFLDVDMRNNHNGLSRLCKEHSIYTEELLDNQLLVFINRAQTHLKVFVRGNIIAHTKRPRIALEAIKEIPKVFGYKGRVDYDEALRVALEDKLRKVRTKNV